MKVHPVDLPKRGYCLFIQTVCEGSVPVEWNSENYPVVYPTRESAQREIADVLITRLQEFLNGEREFEDAVSIEDYIVEVDVLPDGSIIDESGQRFGPKNW